MVFLVLLSFVFVCIMGIVYVIVIFNVINVGRLVC